jgi:hypothetical protein
LIRRKILERRKLLREVRERGHQLLRNGGELNPGIEILGVLPEHDQINSLLVIERVGRVGLARAKADVQIEQLAHPDDRRTVCQSLPLELGGKFCLRGFRGLGCDRPEHRRIDILQEIHRALRKRIALPAPEIPADVTVEILGIER